MIDLDDDPETFKNAPVCLQLVGRTLEEEAVIKMTEMVGAALESAKLA
jgi:amidase